VKQSGGILSIVKSQLVLVGYNIEAKRSLFNLLIIGKERLLFLNKLHFLPSYTSRTSSIAFTGFYQARSTLHPAEYSIIELFVEQQRGAPNIIDCLIIPETVDRITAFWSFCWLNVTRSLNSAELQNQSKLFYSSGLWVPIKVCSCGVFNSCKNGVE
jgi:hypothetical protein